MPSDDVTPIRQQYLDIKKKYPDSLLFFRLGDFYETFDEDARTTSRELEIVLTSRNVAKGSRVPMAGIPYHAVEGYLSRLIRKGYHVAICEQVGDQPARGLFPREVIRVVTPGTVVEPGMLSAGSNNYLCCLVMAKLKAALAFTDITTGEFQVTEITEGDISGSLRGEISRLNPAEIIVPESFQENDVLQGRSTTRLEDWKFESARAEQTLLRHFKVGSLDGFGLRSHSLAIAASGAILHYLQATQPISLEQLTSLKTYQLHHYMILDSVTRRNLEITETIRSADESGSLLSVLDHTISQMGKRLLRQWVGSPLLDIERIRERQACVESFLDDSTLRAEFREAVKPIIDLERVTNRIAASIALPRELVALRDSLTSLPHLKQLFSNHPSRLDEHALKIGTHQEILELLKESINEDPPSTLQNIGVIRPGFSAELDGIVEASRHAREWIANLENIERERTGIKTLKVGYNKVFGYYIEVTHANSATVPAEYIRKQTLVNAERYITPEMKEYETLVLNAESRIHEVENRLYKDVCSRISSHRELLLQTAQVLAELDTYASLAEAASIGKYTRPEILAEPLLDIQDGRHPVVEWALTSGKFVPNDAIFESGEIIRIITGPNMSGKSTFLRQVALIVLMAQIGSFVPASAARIGLVDRIFTRIGAQDEIFAGQSTFMVEMTETANILNHATPRSLLILDEIGRGTSTYDGLSIAWAVVEYIHNHPGVRSRTLFATHYHELIQMAELLPGIQNYNVAVTESGGTVVFLHKIVAGGSDRSYGIHVAQLAGLPAPVIQRAAEILKELETSSGTAFEQEANNSQQLALFPELNPLLEELQKLDLNVLSPIEALNHLYDWQRRYKSPDNQTGA
jgi:DNA mismatch repair protein MutS